MLISLETFFFVTVLWPGAQVQSLFVFRASGVALGALGAVPMFVYGLYLGTRHWPWLDKSRARSARGDKQVNFFGRNRQVGACFFRPRGILVGAGRRCLKQPPNDN